MGSQRTFASVAWNGKGKVTRRERFLAEMDAVIPWPRLVGLIEPHYPKAGNGRQPLGLEKMLRIYFLHRIRWRGIFQCGRVLSAERNHRVRWNDIARAIRRPHRAYRSSAPRPDEIEYPPRVGRLPVVRTGHSTRIEGLRVATYPVKIVDGKIMVAIAAQSKGILPSIG